MINTFGFVDKVSPPKLGWNAEIFEELPKNFTNNSEMDQGELFEALMPFKRKLLMAARIFRILYERSIEELRHEPPEYVFVVDLNWLKRCKDFLYYN